MAVLLAHLLSVLAVAAYGYAALSFRRMLAPAGAGWSSEPLNQSVRYVLGLGLLSHFLFLLLADTGAATTERFPFALSFISISVMGLYLALEQRLRITALGVFIAPVALVFLLVSAIAFHLHESGGGAFPSSTVLSIHLVCTVFSYAFLVVATGASAAFLISEGSLKRKRHLGWSAPFPSLVFLERFHKAVILLGFLFLLLGVATGLAYGEIVQLDASQTLTRLSWVMPVVFLYALIAFSLVALRIRGRRIAWMTIVGCALLVGSLVLTGLVRGSFHLS